MTTIDSKIDLFFFRPSLGKCKYCDEYRKRFPAERYVRYSPLFELRLEIKELIQQKKWFPAILLTEIIVEGIVNYLLSTDKGLQEDCQNFRMEYLKYTKVQSVLIRQLRNAREHNFGMIHTRLKVGTSPFNELFPLLAPHNNEKKYIKLKFNLSEGFPEVAKLFSVKVYTDYYLVEARINPFQYIKDIDSALTLVESVVRDKKNIKLRARFDESITIDNWMYVY